MRYREAYRRLYYFDTADRDEAGTMLITTLKITKVDSLSMTITKPKRPEFYSNV